MTLTCDDLSEQIQTQQLGLKDCFEIWRHYFRPPPNQGSNSDGLDSLWAFRPDYVSNGFYGDAYDDEDGQTCSCSHYGAACKTNKRNYLNVLVNTILVNYI